PGLRLFCGYGRSGSWPQSAKIAKFDRPAEPGTILRPGPALGAAADGPGAVQLTPHRVCTLRLIHDGHGIGADRRPDSLAAGAGGPAKARSVPFGAGGGAGLISGV